MRNGAQDRSIFRFVECFVDLDLTRQFALAGGAVAIVSMLAIGGWVTTRIHEDAVTSAATATARYMDSFIAPLAQELETADVLSIGPIRALDEIVDGPALKDRVVSIKIWKPDGRLVYARDIALIGETFAPSEGLMAARAGNTFSELDELDSEESRDEAAAGIPLLEIYSPIRADWTGEVIAVAEFYENATGLVDQLRRARLQSWLVTAAATIVICMTLFGIVLRGDRLIHAQRAALAARVVETERISEQNRQLRRRAERASRRVTELNEQNLRRVGADLHDGPAQLISLAALRLDALRAGRSKDSGQAFREVAEALESAMAEIRQISRGLVLPELGGLTLEQTIGRAIDSHQARSRTMVTRRVSLGQASAPDAVKICVYRFVQEGLNNAFRHSGGVGQEVAAAITDGRLRLSVHNRVATLKVEPPATGLGLQGLRDRVESLGGALAFDIDGNGLAALAMELDLEKEAHDG